MAVNLLVAVIVTLILRAMKTPDGVDGTEPDDYFADEGDPRLEKARTTPDDTGLLDLTRLATLAERRVPRPSWDRRRLSGRSSMWPRGQPLQHAAPAVGAPAGVQSCSTAS